MLGRHWGKYIVGAVLGVAFVAGLGAVGVAFGANTPVTPCTNTPLSNVALSTTSEVVYAANPRRAKAIISNQSATISIYVACSDAGSAATSAWDTVPPNSTWIEEPVGGFLCRGEIEALAASGTPAIGGSECAF